MPARIRREEFPYPLSIPYATQFPHALPRHGPRFASIQEGYTNQYRIPYNLLQSSTNLLDCVAEWAHRRSRLAKTGMELNELACDARARAYSRVNSLDVFAIEEKIEYTL